MDLTGSFKPPRQTKIIAWNANGLVARKNELANFLISENVDIALIAETHLTVRSHAKIHGYELYTCDHPSSHAHGGSAIYIKNSIVHHVISQFQQAHIQAACISTRLHCGTTVNVASIYSPPKHSIKTEQYCELMSHLGEKWIIGGDFNAKHQSWGSRTNTSKGNELYRAINIHNAASVSSGQPTYWPTDTSKLPDCIDFFVMKNVSSLYTDASTINDLSSDHIPITLTLSDTLLRKYTLPKLTSKNTNWDIFAEHIHNHVNLQLRLKTAEELEKAVNEFNNIITEAARIATPAIPTSMRVTTYPKVVRDQVQKRRKARHLWQITRSPEHKTEFNRQCATTKKLLRKLNQESFDSFVLSLDVTESTDYSLWKVAKATRRPPVYIPPIRMMNGGWARDNQAKADTFALHLADTFQPNNITTNVTPTINYEHKNIGIKYFSPREISAAIKKLNPCKAPGFDLITARILKELPRKGIVMLTYLFNATLRLKYIPTQWKSAKVIMLLKPGKPPDDTKSYRPISLLPTISKLYEKLLLKRLCPIIDNLGIIPDHQFGFRAKHATIEQIHRVVQVIRDSLENKKFCPTAFLDVSQAFDKVWIEGLIHKISQYLPDHYVRILLSYLTNRTFRVYHNEAISPEYKTAAGVPQGSVLAPILYLLYTADMPMQENVVIATFADDTAVLAPHHDYNVAVDNLQKAVDKITKWSSTWKIRLNSQKSIRVDFALRKHGYTPTLINDEPVTYSDNARYLGLHLDKRLTWKYHLHMKRETINQRFRSISWLLRATNKLSLHNKRLLYQALIKPIWTYGIQIWGSTARSNLNIIQRLQNKIIRKMVGAPWYISNDQLHSDLCLPTVEETAKSLTEAYEKRLHHHPNIEAIQLLNAPQSRRLKRIHIFDIA